VESRLDVQMQFRLIFQLPHIYAFLPFSVQLPSWCDWILKFCGRIFYFFILYSTFYLPPLKRSNREYYLIRASARTVNPPCHQQRQSLFLLVPG